MDLSAGLLPYVMLPTAAFIDVEELTALSESWPESSYIDGLNNDISYWESSSLNPKNRINTLHIFPSFGWRVDGCTAQGTQFFATPTYLLPSPLRIDVFIPEQSKHPRALRNSLGSNVVFHSNDKRITELGISRYIVQVLEYWSCTVPDFAKYYRSLPFGTRIVIDRLSSQVRDANVHVIDDYHVQRVALSLGELQSFWRLRTSTWPSMLDVHSLQLINQLSETISLVQIPSLDASNEYVLKSSTDSLKFLYHELKLLLTMPEHANIISRPLYIVTQRSDYGNEDKVVGFILQYHEQGSLREIVPSRAARNQLLLGDQVRWAKQIVSALIFIREDVGRFVSDLKMDNILLSAANDIVLIDFEQRGNWIWWSAPEIHYFEYLEKLASSKLVPVTERQRYAEILKNLNQNSTEGNDDDPYTDPPSGYYRAWLALSSEEQESAEVFSVGKTLWCIFENVGVVTNMVTRSFTYEPEIEFPEFRKTPVELRALIEACTRGAREWNPMRASKPIRKGFTVYPRQGFNSKTRGSAREAISALKVMGQEEVGQMEIFFAAKVRVKNGTSSPEDEELLKFLNRPTLAEVFDTIRAYETTI